MGLVPVPMQSKSPDAYVLLYFLQRAKCGIGTGTKIGTGTNAGKVAGCICFTILYARAVPTPRLAFKIIKGGGVGVAIRLSTQQRGNANNAFSDAGIPLTLYWGPAV